MLKAIRNCEGQATDLALESADDRKGLSISFRKEFRRDHQVILAGAMMKLFPDQENRGNCLAVVYFRQTLSREQRFLVMCTASRLRAQDSASPRHPVSLELELQDIGAYKGVNGTSCDAYPA